MCVGWLESSPVSMYQDLFSLHLFPKFDSLFCATLFCFRRIFDLLPTIHPVYTCESQIKFIARIFCAIAHAMQREKRTNLKRELREGCTFLNLCTLNDASKWYKTNILKWKFIGRIIWLFWWIFIGSAIYGFKIGAEMRHKANHPSNEFESKEPFFRSIRILNDSSRMCFWLEWLVRCFPGKLAKWKMQTASTTFPLQFGHTISWCLFFFLFFKWKSIFQCDMARRDAHENTNHKNGALCATEWARANKKKPSRNFSKELPIRLRFIFKSHLLYWTRNTQTVVAKKAFDFTINYSEREKKSAAKKRQK